MFFLLSKTMYFLAKPLTWVVLSLVLSIFVKRRRKTLLWLGVGLLLWFSNPFISNVVMRAWEVAPVPIQTLPILEVGIVLGGITTDKEPRDRVHVSSSSDRILHAVQLYREGKIRKILVSGGSGKLIKDQVPEAVLLKQLLLQCDIPLRNIIVEPESRNTHENAVNCAKILSEQYPNKEYLLITSAYHMRRAEASFIKAGLMVNTYATDLRSDENQYTPDQLLLPNVGAMANWEIVVREWVGMVAYAVAGYI